MKKFSNQKYYAASLSAISSKAVFKHFSLDETVINSLLQNTNVMRKLIVGLNYADKIEPLSRNYPFEPSYAQRINLERKAQMVSQALNVPKQQVLYYSASEGYKRCSMQ